MRKQILHFGQNHDSDDKTSYVLYVSASGSMGDLFKIRTELEKKLFKTEMKEYGFTKPCKVCNPPD